MGCVIPGDPPQPSMPLALHSLSPSPLQQFPAVVFSLGCSNLAHGDTKSKKKGSQCGGLCPMYVHTCLAGTVSGTSAAEAVSPGLCM